MKTQKLMLSLAAMIAIGMLAFPGTLSAQGREPGGAAMITASTSATVKAIDPEKRTVTLESSDGATSTIKCGKNVVNFDQIKVGDQVRAVAMERIVVLVGKAGSPSEGAGAIIARAPKGEKPGFFIAETEEMTEKIDSVDAANQTVTLQGVEGKPQTIKVASDVDLSGVKKGDDVIVRCTKGLAIRVESPEGAQPAAGAIKPGETDGIAMAASASATVESIDSAKRMVTLKNADGETKTIHLGKECINFDQIKVGDKVKATLAEEVALSVSKGGAPPSAGEGAIIVRAPQGAKPGVIIAESAQVTGKIESIDAGKQSITLAEADGKPRTIKVGPKVNLSDLKAGDDVTARVTKALAIVVETP